MFPAFQLWQELKMLPDTGRTVDQKEIAIKEIYWQSIFQRLNVLVKIIAEQNLPFSGIGLEK